MIIIYFILISILWFIIIFLKFIHFIFECLNFTFELLIIILSLKDLKNELLILNLLFLLPIFWFFVPDYFVLQVMSQRRSLCYTGFWMKYDCLVFLLLLTQVIWDISTECNKWYWTNNPIAMIFQIVICFLFMNVKCFGLIQLANSTHPLAHFHTTVHDKPNNSCICYSNRIL